MRAKYQTALAVVLTLFALSPVVHAQDAKTYEMKLSTATLNDPQHEWLRRFAAAVEKDSGGRIKPQVFPASQLGSIPRQIEGTQFGSIQAWAGPPEFLTGVDVLYETLSAPGLFSSAEQDLRVINDPPVKEMMLGLGADKGLQGIAIVPLGPSSIAARKAVRHLAEYAGMKIRVLASPFQLEMIKRMNASPVAMSLADVLPALQQGALDGALGTVPVFGPLHYVETAKFLTEIGQPYVNTIVVMNKKWVEELPADLQKVIHDDASAVSKEMVPFLTEFFQAQRKQWIDNGGELISLPTDEQAALNAELLSIGDDLSKDKPQLNKAVKLVFESAQRNK